ncbi:MAG: hypothetical protein PPP58_01160 [Natronomonas sp.]
MKRTVSILLAALMVTSVLGAVPLGAALQDDAEDAEEDIQPGEQLSGVVGVQEAEIDGEIEDRAFGIKLAQAASDDARADVVAEQLQRNEQRIEELEERQEQLRQQREAGEITEGTYRAEIARNAAEVQNLKRTTNRGADAAASFPDKLEERGIDTERIQTLQQRADELTGPEVAEIARGIAGDRVGTPMGPDRGDRAGPDRDRPGVDRPDTDREQRAGDAGNESEAIAIADHRLDEEADEDAAAALQRCSSVGC